MLHHGKYGIMTLMAEQKLVTVNVATDARDALRTLAFALTGRAGRRVTLSDALRAACAVAMDDQDSATAALAEKGTDDE